MKRISERIVICLFLFVLATIHAAPAEIHSIAPPFYDTSGAELEANGSGGISLDFRLDRVGDRFYYDIPLRNGMPSDATSFVVEAALNVDGFISGASLHVHTGSKWFEAGLPLPLSRRSRVTLPVGRLLDDSGEKGVFSSADKVRISIWAAEPNVTGQLVLYRVQVRRDQVAIANTGASIALDRCRTLFDAAGIPYAEISGDFSAAADFHLVAIPEVPDPFAAACLRNVRKAVTADTRFIVFYSGSRELGALLGIEPGVWVGAKPEMPWRAMLPVASVLDGFNDTIPSPTANIIPPYARRKAVSVAFWADALGRVTDVPACVVSPNCAWFAHLPPLPVSPANEFMRRICLRFVPELVQDFAVTALMEHANLLEVPQSGAAGAVVATIERAVENREGLAEIPRLCMKLRDTLAREQLIDAGPIGEIRAVWDSRARFRSTAERGNILRRLSASGINSMFACVGDAQSAAECEDLDAFIERADTERLPLHAWIYALALDDHNVEGRKRFAREGRLMVSATGEEQPWLCPVNAENRALLIETAKALARRGVDGVHLDYMRYPSAEGCLCKTCRVAFEEHSGARVRHWPADVLGRGKQAVAFGVFQTKTLTQRVVDVATAVRSIRSDVIVSAAVFPEKTVAISLHQDWPEWIQAGSVDFVCPMIYQADEAVFASQLHRAIAAAGGRAEKILPGIGTTADVQGPDAYGATLQIIESRRRQCRGFSFFSLDDYLFDSILSVVDLSQSSD